MCASELVTMWTLWRARRIPQHDAHGTLGSATSELESRSAASLLGHASTGTDLHRPDTSGQHPDSQVLVPLR
jgi:hypothetical protein